MSPVRLLFPIFLPSLRFDHPVLHFLSGLFLVRRCLDFLRRGVRLELPPIANTFVTPSKVDIKQSTYNDEKGN